jgi:hypothetical protein
LHSVIHSACGATRGKYQFPQDFVVQDFPVAQMIIIPVAPQQIRLRFDRVQVD